MKKLILFLRKRYFYPTREPTREPVERFYSREKQGYIKVRSRILWNGIYISSANLIVICNALINQFVPELLVDVFSFG